MKDPAERQEAVRNFRFGLIAPAVTRAATEAERYALLREVAKGEYQTPWGRTWRPNIETLRRYVAAYERGGLAALTPAPRGDRGKSRAIPPELLAEAVALRREVPTRSVQQVIDILVLAGRCQPGELKRSTLHDHLERAGAGKRALKDLQKKQQAARRFAASHRNEIWMGDCQHTLHLPDPDASERRRQVYLLAFLDDYSRLITHAEFYWQERLPKLEDCLKKAILRCGAPQTLYVDNGAIYIAEQLQRICGELCIELVHSRPGRPQGRGKLEKWFQLVDRSFLPEALPLIDKGQLRTLDQLNELFWAWLEVGYHQRLHNATKATPRQRYDDDPATQRRFSLDRLREVFVWQEYRKVDKTGCFSLAGNTYETEATLAGQTITVRFDPFDLATIQVWHDGRRLADAVPLELKRHRDRRVAGTVPPVAAPTGLNYLELLRQRQAVEQQQALGRMSYQTPPRPDSRQGGTGR